MLGVVFGRMCGGARCTATAAAGWIGTGLAPRIGRRMGWQRSVTLWTLLVGTALQTKCFWRWTGHRSYGLLVAFVTHVQGTFGATPKRAMLGVVGRLLRPVDFLASCTFWHGAGSTPRPRFGGLVQWPAALRAHLGCSFFPLHVFLPTFAANAAVFAAVICVQMGHAYHGLTVTALPDFLFRFVARPELFTGTAVGSGQLSVLFLQLDVCWIEGVQSFLLQFHAHIAPDTSQAYLGEALFAKTKLWKLGLLTKGAGHAGQVRGRGLPHI